MHLASIKDCIFYKDYLDNQNVKIGEEEKNYDCYCKLVNVNKDMRLY